VLLGSFAIILLLLAPGDSAPKPASRTGQESLVVGTVVMIQPKTASITIRQSDLLKHGQTHYVSYHLSQKSLSLDLRPGDKIMGTLAGSDRILHVLKHSRGGTQSARK
jgi:hypothetical protein